MSFVKFDMELPIHGTENVNTQFHHKITSVNFVCKELILPYKKFICTG
jgi:hypothetical protein